MSTVGTWKNISEAEKLTQSVLIGGIVEEDVKMGRLTERLPLWQLTGKDVQWNREGTEVNTAQTAEIGSLLTWQSAETLSKQTTALKILYIQTLLDHFVEGTYGSHNNYEQIQLVLNKKRMLDKIEDLLLYGDLTYSAGTREFDGFHALSQASDTNFPGDSLDVDMLEAGLSLKTMRDLEDRMLHGIDFWLFPKAIANRLDAYMQEAGLSTNTFGSLSFTVNELGARVPSWNGKPILRSDYLVAEQANTGVGSDARAKRTSGDNQYSIFAVKLGQVANDEPGLTLAWGGKDIGAGDMWKLKVFDDMEDQDSGGIRLVTYMSLLDGASTALGRIYDIEDVAIVA